MRLAGSGDSNVNPPSAASTVRRRRLLRRTATAPDGAVAASAGRGIGDLAALVFDENFLALRIGQQAAILKRVDDRKRERLPLLASAPTAASVSEKESLANCATASSKGPASAGTPETIININAIAAARQR